MFIHVQLFVYKLIQHTFLPPLQFGGKLLLQDAGEPKCDEGESCERRAISALGLVSEEVQPDTE